MDALLAEIEKKKKQLNDTKEKIGEKKYLKRSDIERLREEEYFIEQKRSEEERIKKKKRVDIDKKVVVGLSLRDDNQEKAGSISKPVPTTEQENVEQQHEIVGLDDKEIKSRLRAKGHPILLFGETRADRISRLQKIMAVEDRIKPVTFKNLLEATEQDLAESLYKGSDGVKTKDEPAANEIDTKGISLELVKNDLETACDLMVIYFKRVLRDWGMDLRNRPDEVKRTPKGKLDAITHAQTIEHLKPFWKGLRKRTLALDIMGHVATISKHMQNQSYMQANDAYIRLAIGNAPWPIGVTSSGIHQRAGDDRIKTSDIAHVLNDEVQRKYIQGIKRLIAFEERRNEKNIEL